MSDSGGSALKWHLSSHCQTREAWIPEADAEVPEGFREPFGKRETFESGNMSFAVVNYLLDSHNKV